MILPTMVTVGLFCLPINCLASYTVVCESDSECQEDSSAYCNLTASKCACREDTIDESDHRAASKLSNNSQSSPPAVGLFLINSKVKCLSGKPLNHPCSYDEQCHLVDGNSHCSNATICKCVNGFLSFNGSCHNLQERNKNSSTSNEINLEMLPIMIVLGLMFIGMCVALNMFSRARFRNQRGVFTAPRTAARALKDIQVKKNDRRYSTRPSIVSEHLEVIVDPNLLETQVTDTSRRSELATPSRR